MPVMLDSDGVAQWLNDDAETKALAALLEPALVAPLVVTPVDQAIHNSRNKVEPQPVGDSKTIQRLPSMAGKAPLR